MFSPLIQYSIDGDARKLQVVEAVGCLGQSTAKTWMLTNASNPVVTKTQSTSSSALRAAAEIPLGIQTYQLLGARVFDPRRHGKRKVAVKGVLIKDASDNRLNVTSLQAVTGTCSGLTPLARNDLDGRPHN
jgi:hypothetical protein